MLDFTNKVVVVTGAAGQIGTELCKRYSSLGAKVIGFDKTVNSEDYSSIRGASFQSLDVTNYLEVEKAFKQVTIEFGNIDVLINNAGVGVFEHFLERSEQDFDWVVDVNMKGVFFCIRAFASIRDEGSPKSAIVNIGSIYGTLSPDFRIYGENDRRSAEVYGATKAGVIQLTKYFAIHFAKLGIRINCVSPGGIYNPSNPQDLDFVRNYSDRCPMGRMAEVSEIVGAIQFLSSDAASYITGQNLMVDGGYSSW